ncbi:hypothetical protein Efla_006099 [Eimeria flavescens]
MMVEGFVAATGKGPGGPSRGAFRWRPVAVAPGLEGEGFLGLEELVFEDEKEEGSIQKEKKKNKKNKKRKRTTDSKDEASPPPTSSSKKKKKSAQQLQQQQLQQDEEAQAAADAPSTQLTAAATSTAAAASGEGGAAAAAAGEEAAAGRTAAEAAAAAPTAAAAAAAAFECMYDSYELVGELESALGHWKAALGGDLCVLHPAVSRVLLQQQLLRPTPVQQQVLLHAIRDRKDVVAAAQTGSGKTLAFALPIVSSIASQLARRLEKWQERRNKDKEQQLLQQLQQQQQQQQQCSDEEEADETQRQQFLLQQVQPQGPAALVLEPTRELALQVFHVLQQLCAYTPIRVAAVIGGLSAEKQLRILGSCKPLILVATPGRLLALQRQQQHPAAAAGDAALGQAQQQQQIMLLQQQSRRERLAAEGLAFGTNFSLLQFLVLDEADRLLQQQQQQQQQRKKKKQQQKQQKHRKALPPPTETEELLQLVYGQLDAAPPKGSNASSSSSSNSNSKSSSKRVKQQKQQKMPGQLRGRAANLQTFVLSATLALALQRKQQGLKVISSSSSSSSSGSGEGDEVECAAAAALLQHVRIRAKALVAVRISEEQQQQHVWEQQQQQRQQQQQQEHEEVTLQQQHNGKLPSTLRLSVWKCPLESDLEMHVAAYMLRTFDRFASEAKPVKMLLFVNAISYVYRLESLLNLLLQEQLQQRRQKQIEVVGLHSNLQQKQRLKRLERFKRSAYGLLVCGLLHAGEAVCFVCGAAARQWASLFAAAGIDMLSAPPPLGFSDLAAFQEKAANMKRLFQLANQVEREQHQKHKRKRTVGTLRAMAAAADIEPDSDAASNGSSSEEEALRDRQQQLARSRLRQVKATHSSSSSSSCSSSSLLLRRVKQTGHKSSRLPLLLLQQQQQQPRLHASSWFWFSPACLSKGTVAAGGVSAAASFLLQMLASYVP